MEKTNVESLITKGVKVLIICPQDGAAAAAAADEAHQAGVKVISYDRLIRDTAAVDYYVTFDSVQVGAAWGKYLEPGSHGQGQQPVHLRRCRLRQQRLPLLPGRLERAAAQDRRRHLHRAQLQRSRRPQGQGQADPRRAGRDHRPDHHELELQRREEQGRGQPDRRRQARQGQRLHLRAERRHRPGHRRRVRGRQGRERSTTSPARTPRRPRSSTSSTASSP